MNSQKTLKAEPTVLADVWDVGGGQKRGAEGDSLRPWKDRAGGRRKNKLDGRCSEAAGP